MTREEPAATCRPLREMVNPGRRQLPPEDVYPVEPWRIVEQGFYPRLLPQTETIFAISNGYLGIRATPEEAAPVHEAGTFLNGFYETWPIPYGEQAHGFATTGQTMLTVPNGAVLKLYVDDEPFDLATARLQTFERVLDFRTGTLERKVRFDTADDKRVEVRSKRFASFENRHLVGISYEVEMLRGHASMAVSSELVMHDDTGEQAERDQRRPGAASRCGLMRTDYRARDQRVLFDLKACASGLRMACAMDHSVEADSAVEVEEADCAEDRGRVVFHCEAKQGQRLRIVKFLSYHHSSSADAGELRFRANRTLDRALRQGLEHALADQRRRVDEFWAAADVEIDGDAEVQQAVRFNLFQLLQASARAEGFGIPAKGLTGLGYEGHYFWDTEIYVLPFLTHTNPRLARNLLRFRHTHLSHARRRAREVSQAGALFPWRTISGEEASAYYAAGTAQYHINADIVYAADRYVMLTGDSDFCQRELAEIAVETARLWADLGFYSDRRGGQFCINGVTGPDEYNTVVNNNAYTNLMARENLRIAIKIVGTLREKSPDLFDQLVQATSLDLQELEEWRRAAEHIYIPIDDATGVYLQDDDFLEREPWDPASIPPERFPLLLHYHPLVIYRHQVIKQADLVLATFLLNEHFSQDEKRRIFDFYDPLTTGDSSLSACIQSIVASELGYHSQAYDYFVDAIAMDLGDIGGNVKHGIHVASAAGSWMAVVCGFAGVRTRDGRLRFCPSLPEGWRRLQFRLRVREQQLEVTIAPGRAEYRLLTGESLEIHHQGQSITVSKAEPVTVQTVTMANVGQ